MSAAARLALFGAALLAVFALASVAGAALDAGDGVETEQSHEEEEMEMAETDSHETEGAGAHGGEAAGGAATATAALPGLAVEQDGYRLVIDEDSLEPGEPGTLGFRILDAEGETVSDFETEHERRMHLILVRRDLSGFQHLHPEQRPDGSWRTPVTVAEAGDYRVYADFALPERSLTLAADVFVPGDFHSHELPAESNRADAGDGYEVGLREGEGGKLRFEVSRDGKPLAGVQPYLGADGHLVVLREGDGAFLHVHPLGKPGGSGPIEFVAEFPSAGSYRMFLQFKDRGRVHTAEFTKQIGRTPAGAGEGHGGGHSHE